MSSASLCSASSQRTPGGWSHTTETFDSEGAGSSAVSAATRLTSWATFLVPLRPSVGSTTVVLVLHQRVSADREQFRSLHRAGVDENDIACRVLSRTHSLC